MHNARLLCPDDPPRVGRLCPGSGDPRVAAPGDRVTCLYGWAWVDRMAPADIEALELPVDPNAASLAELETLPRVGPKTAARIVANRPYGSASQLLDVSGIGPKTFAGLKGRVRVRPRSR